MGKHRPILLPSHSDSYRQQLNWDGYGRQWKPPTLVGPSLFLLVTSMGGFCGLRQASLKCWLPSLISMLLWSSANLPNSRLCLLFGQIAWDWCCCCGFRLWAAVVGHNAAPTCQREMEEVAPSTKGDFQWFCWVSNLSIGLWCNSLLSLIFFLLSFFFLIHGKAYHKIYFLNHQYLACVASTPNKATVLFFTLATRRPLGWDRWAIYRKCQQQIPARDFLNGLSFSQAQVILSHMNDH